MFSPGSLIILFTISLFSAMAFADDAAPEGSYHTRKAVLMKEVVQVHVSIYKHQSSELHQVSDRKLKRLKERRMSLACELILLKQMEPFVKMPVSNAPGLLLPESGLVQNGLDTSVNKAFSFEEILATNKSAKSNLKLGAAFIESELLLTKNYARSVFEKSRESVMLASHFAGESLPGFDGVVFDADDNAVANFSLKNSKDRKLEEAIEIGIEKGLRYGDLDEWMPWAERSPVSAPVLHPYADAAWIPELKRVEKAFHYGFRWLRTALAVVGLKPGENKNASRPLRLVVNITDYRLTLLRQMSDFEKIQKKIRRSKGRIESVVLILGDSLLIIDAKNIDVQ